MLQVFKPFKVADGDSASVAEYVWEEFYPFSSADALTFNGGRPIGSFNNNTAFKAVSIVLVNRHFKSSGDEDIAE